MKKLINILILGPILSKIGAWSSNQSKPMETRDALLNKIDEYKKNLQIKIMFQDQALVWIFIKTK